MLYSRVRQSSTIGLLVACLFSVASFSVNASSEATLLSKQLAVVEAPILSQAKQPSHTCRKGQVYAMRGGILGVFSTGMAKLATTLEHDYQICASSTVYHNIGGLSHFIIEHYQSGELTGPIILVGHSLGANEQIVVARDLSYAHIPVALLITVDAGMPMKVPTNVAHVLNLYKPTWNPIFKGVPVEAQDTTQTLVENIDVSQLQDLNVNHFTISQNAMIQSLMLKNILATL